MMAKADRGAGVIITGGPNCFLQAMTAVTMSLDHFVAPKLS